MIAPANANIYEGYLAAFWMDETGILCANGKNVLRTLQNQKENYELIKQITGSKKVCLLSNTTNSSPPDKETRDYIEKQLPAFFKAMAIISQSAVGQIIPKIFTTVNINPIPIQYFTNEHEARQ